MYYAYKEKNLDEIRPFYDVDLIKVITGLRRSGKSVILKQIMDEIIKNGVKKENIIYINFELVDYDDITDYKKLVKYVDSKMINNDKYYMFFDEIQYVKGFEKAINSYKAKYGDKVSIFISGSNSDLLSGEFATLLSGRYVSFKVNPLTFKEACELQKIDLNDGYKVEKAFDNYIEWGGLPQRFVFNGDDEVITYLTDVYNSIVIRDIIRRFNITDVDLFNKIAEYIVTTPSQVFSADNLSKYFINNANRTVSKTTLYNYLDYMNKAFLISKAERKDLRGKEILKGGYKYYLTDLGLGQILNTNKRPQLGAYLENVVYNELIYRGYDVKVGSLDDSEVDFIATKNKDKIYIQVCYVLADQRIIDREFGIYKKIEDNYPKYVISTDKIDFSHDGIIHKNIIEWLLEDY